MTSTFIAASVREVKNGVLQKGPAFHADGAMTEDLVRSGVSEGVDALRTAGLETGATIFEGL